MAADEASSPAPSLPCEVSERPSRLAAFDQALKATLSLIAKLEGGSTKMESRQL